MKQPVISRNPDSRNPDVMGGFPSVTRAQVIAFLEEAKERMIEAAS